MKMGLIDWLRKTFKLTTQYVIVDKEIEMPGPGKCLIFQFPKHTPKSVIYEFDKRLIEFQNMERKFITTNMEVEIYAANKKQLKIGGDDASNKDKRYIKSTREGQNKERYNTALNK